MEEGFLGDNSRSGVLQSRWYPGTAEPEKFLGMELSNLTVDPRQALAVTTFRCTQCGFLESYAAQTGG
ncbi:MAG: hypothetical protein HY319_16770 [Armatimonadetes bacterium]|nr:hypothetical protein [Armatimonadota bacterium]